jgi:perosamine synthetase
VDKQVDNSVIDMAGPSITEHEEKVVLDALRNGWYGKQAYYYVEKFEAEFASYHNRKHGLMTPNCTTALHLLLGGLGIADGDEVIAPECTWIGSVACISYQRAKTVFADIDPVHWCVTAESIEREITNRTKAVIVVDLYGNMPDWEAIAELCKRRNIILVEDAAEALGSIAKGKRAGSFGIASTFSFHRTKTLTTGEGGMLLIDDDELFARCKFLRDHGRAPGTYFNTEVTFKYMPFNLQAALGYAQFQRLDELVAHKRKILNGYKRRLADIPDIALNPEPKDGVNGAWNTALVFGHSHKITKDKAMTELTGLGLPSRPFFYPLSFLPAYGSREVEMRPRHPIAYDVSERGINLPSAFSVDDTQMDRMCDGIRRILHR